MDSYVHMGVNEEVMRRADYKQVVRWMIVIAIFLFLGKMASNHWGEIKGTSFTFKVVPFILSTLIFAFSYLIQAWAWYLITLKLGIALSPSETIETWFYSQLGKYLPGKVWLLLGRFYLYDSKGKSKKVISIALYFETILVILSGGLIFLAALVFFKEIRSSYDGNQFWWVILLFIIALVSLHPRVLLKILNWILVQLNREPISLSISYSEVLGILIFCVVAWMIGGIGFYLFVDSVYPVSSNYILFLTGALAISSTLGLMAIFAPSGLGVREGALVYLLSFLMATPVAVIISILTRIWMTLIEIGLIGMVYLFRQLQKREKEHGEI